MQPTPMCLRYTSRFSFLIGVRVRARRVSVGVEVGVGGGVGGEVGGWGCSYCGLALLMFVHSPQNSSLAALADAPSSIALTCAGSIASPVAESTAAAPPAAAAAPPPGPPEIAKLKPRPRSPLLPSRSPPGDCVLARRPPEIGELGSEIWPEIGSAEPEPEPEPEPEIEISIPVGQSFRDEVFSCSRV